MANRESRAIGQTIGIEGQRGLRRTSARIRHAANNNTNPQRSSSYNPRSGGRKRKTSSVPKKIMGAKRMVACKGIRTYAKNGEPGPSPRREASRGQGLD